MVFEAVQVTGKWRRSRNSVLIGCGKSKPMHSSNVVEICEELKHFNNLIAVGVKREIWSNELQSPTWSYTPHFVEVYLKELK